MSVHRNRVGGWDVRWREGGKSRSRTFRLKRDADRFDLQIKDAKQTGMLSRIHDGAETLDEYVENTWAPIHAAALAPKTRTLYTGLYDAHISPTLDAYALRNLTPEIIGRWQADRLAAGAARERTRKALTLLGGILQRAVEAQRIPANPQRLVRKAAPDPHDEVRPMAPITVERIRRALLARAGRDARSTRRDVLVLCDRDAVMVSLLAYAGLRPQEMRALLGPRAGAHADRSRREDAAPPCPAAHRAAARPARAGSPRVAARLRAAR